MLWMSSILLLFLQDTRSWLGHHQEPGWSSSPSLQGTQHGAVMHHILLPQFLAKGYGKQKHRLLQKRIRPLREKRCSDSCYMYCFVTAAPCGERAGGTKGGAKGENHFKFNFLLSVWYCLLLKMSFQARWTLFPPSISTAVYWLLLCR